MAESSSESAGTRGAAAAGPVPGPVALPPTRNHPLPPELSPRLARGRTASLRRRSGGQYRSARANRGGRYRPVLGTPGVPWVLVTSLAARLAQPIAALAVVILAAEQTESFAVGGAASAAWLGCSGLGCLISSRLVDEGHARAALRGTGILSGMFLTILAALPTSDPVLLIGLTALAGLTAPPVVPATRSMWSALLPNPDAQGRIAALDASLQELTYIVGPAVAGGAAALASPRLSVAIAAAVSLLGAELFSAAPGLHRPARPRPGRGAPPGPTPLALPIAVSALLVASFSYTEVAVIGAADRAGAMAASGPLLAGWGVGSLIAGVLVGARAGRRHPERRLLGLLAGIAVSTAGYAAVHPLILLAASLALGGAFVAPALAALDAWVLRIAPAGAVARTSAAVAAAGLGGSAIGAIGAGTAVQMAGPAVAFLTGGAEVALAALLLAGLPLAARLDRRSRANPPAPPPPRSAPVDPPRCGTACCGRKPCWERDPGSVCR
jgi:predicted MFS family arabinose efflux permease